jgi:hypothetical protein
MHRSGTSLVAGVLNRHGLWLGEEEELMPADPNNPDGYYENTALVDINNDILIAFGGTWDAPPMLPAGFEDDKRLAPLRQRAGEVMASFGERPWGFKDPRACLTIPFWRAMANDLRFVVCLRNPLEVARSLGRRDGISEDLALHLWFVHYGAVLAATGPDERVLVDYQALCAEPMAVAAALLARVPARLRPLDAGAVKAAVRPTLRHYRSSAEELTTAGVPENVLETYTKLLAEVPPRPVRATRRPLWRAKEKETDHEKDAGNAGDLEPVLAAWDLELRDLQIELRRLAATVTRLEGELERDGELERARQTGVATAMSGLADRVELLNRRLAAMEAERKPTGQSALAVVGPGDTAAAG